MFATYSVTVYQPSELSSRDRFGNADVQFSDGTECDGVLVAPSSTSDLEAERPDGVMRRLQLHFPKTWTTSLRGCYVEVGGDVFRVIGDPWPYMPENTPGDWWLPVEVELANG